MRIADVQGWGKKSRSRRAAIGFKAALSAERSFFRPEKQPVEYGIAETGELSCQRAVRARESLAAFLVSMEARILAT